MKKFNIKKGPFIKSSNSTKKMMKNLFIALIPIILFSFYKNGILPYIKGKTDVLGMLYPLIFIFSSSICTYLIEAIYYRFLLNKKDNELKKELSSSFGVFPGLFLSLILPINTPISILIFGCIMATVIGKIVYGGFGNNIFNPALIGRLFIIATYAAVISSNGGYLNNYELDTISSATPLTNQAVVEGIGTYSTLVKPYGSLIDFFVGTIPGAIGETSALLCIAGFIFLAYKKVIKWKIPVFYIGTVFIMTTIIARINDIGFWYPTFQILSGGLMFGAVFMATDPVTSPTTSVGQTIYGIFLGILTVVLRYLTPLPEGVLTSILTMNMFVMILDRIGSSNRIAIKKFSLPFIISIILLLSISYKIGYDFKNTNQKGDSNYSVLSSEKINNKIIYTVTQKGNGGLIKASITFENDKIIDIEVLENNETPTYYQLIINSKYIESLIKNQNTINDIDTVSGATISSTALKKMVTNTINDYGDKYE